MRFEHILQIYWTKGLFFGGKLFYTNKNWYEIFQNTPGLGESTKINLLNRLEISYSVQNVTSDVLELEKSENVDIVNTLNVIFSQINSVNGVVGSLKHLNIVRLYLIKSYKGRCHALGKPVNGQRTWSNAWNSYNVNRLLRHFIAETKKQLRQNFREEKINYKMTKKKYATKAKKSNKSVKKKSLWL